MNKTLLAFVLGIVLAIPAINFMESLMTLLEGAGLLAVAALVLLFAPEACRVVRHAATEESVADN